MSRMHAEIDRLARRLRTHLTSADGDGGITRTRSTTYWRACTDCTRCCGCTSSRKRRTTSPSAPESDAAPTADAAGTPTARPPATTGQIPLQPRRGTASVQKCRPIRRTAHGLPDPDLAGRGRVVTQNAFGVTHPIPKTADTPPLLPHHRTLATVPTRTPYGVSCSLVHVGSACSASCTGMSPSWRSASSSRESNRTPNRLGSCGFTQALEPFGRRACDPTPDADRPSGGRLLPDIRPGCGHDAVW